MEELQNSPLLRKLNPRRETHHSNKKNKGISKLSLRAFGTPKANIPEGDSLLNRIILSRNEPVKAYSSTDRNLKLDQNNSELQSKNSLYQGTKSDTRFFNFQASCNVDLKSKQEICDHECSLVQSDADTDDSFKIALNFNDSKTNSDRGITNVSSKDNLYENVKKYSSLNPMPKSEQEIHTQHSDFGFKSELKKESTWFCDKLNIDNETSFKHLISPPSNKFLNSFTSPVSSDLSAFYYHGDELKGKVKMETDNKRYETPTMPKSDTYASALSASSFSCTRHEKNYGTGKMFCSETPDNTVVCVKNGNSISTSGKCVKESNLSNSYHLAPNTGINKKKAVNAPSNINDENINLLTNIGNVQEKIDLNQPEYSFIQNEIRPNFSENSCSGKKGKVLLDILNSSGDSPPPLSERLKIPGSHKSAKNSSNKINFPSITISSSDSSDEFEEFLGKVKKPASLNVSSGEKIKAERRRAQTHLSEPISTPPKTKVKVKKNNMKLSPLVSTQKHFITPSKSVPIKRSVRKNILSSDEDSSEDVFITSLNLMKTPVHKQNSGTNEKKNSFDSKSSFISSLSSDVPQSVADPEAFRFRKYFGSKKNDLLKKLYSIYNETVFNNQLPTDMKITWNSRMRKTAGFCYYKNDPSTALGRTARIELAPKVLDAADRLRDTLIHEMCHAASWIIHGYRDGHGPLWKFWASRANQAFPELPKVSRCHSYEISTKYVYTCTKCGGRIGRHSKSLDINKKICGRCGGRFELLINGKKSSSTSTPTGFALFVKENYKNVKKMNGQVKHAEVMRLLSAEFSTKAKIS